MYHIVIVDGLFRVHKLQEHRFLNSGLFMVLFLRPFSFHKFLHPKIENQPGKANAKSGNHISGIMYPQNNAANAKGKGKQKQEAGEEIFRKGFCLAAPDPVNEKTKKYKRKQGMTAGKTVCPHMLENRELRPFSFKQRL